MSKKGPLKKSDTNPYIYLEDPGVPESERITENVFKEIVSSAIAQNVSHYESISFMRNSPLPFVKQKCREVLLNENNDIPEAHLRNKTIMFSVLRTLFDEVAEILLRPQSDDFYRMYAIQVQNISPDSSDLDEAVRHLRDEDLQVVIKLLGDVAESVGAKALFNEYARKQTVQPRGKTMIDGLKEDSDVPPPSDPASESPSTDKDGLWRIPHPDKKKRKKKTKRLKALVPKHTDTLTDGLFTDPAPKVDPIPKLPVFVPQSKEEREILAQGSENPESVRFTPEPSVEQVQSDSGVDVEIASTPHEIEDEPTVDLEAELPPVETAKEDSMRPTLPDAPESIRSASGKGEDEIEDEETWVNEPAEEPAPAVEKPIPADNTVSNDTLRPSAIPDAEVEKPDVIQQSTSTRDGDVRAHVPPMRPPSPSQSTYKPEEPKVMFGDIQEEYVKRLPKASPDEDTKRNTVPAKSRRGRRMRMGAMALAGLTALGAVVVDRLRSSNSSVDTIESSNVPVPPAPSAVHTTAPPNPVPAPTSKPQPKPQPGPSPDPKPVVTEPENHVTEPHKVAEFDASSVDSKNALLKKLVEDGEFTLTANAGGVNVNFYNLAVNGYNIEQIEKIRTLQHKLTIGVHAYYVKKFGHLTPSQRSQILQDPSHKDHELLRSAVSRLGNDQKTWSQYIGKEKYWEKFPDAYEYGKLFIEEMLAKGYEDIHFVGVPGDKVSIEGVTHWADILDIMEVRRKAGRSEAGSQSPNRKEDTNGKNQKDGSPSQPHNKSGGKQGYWQPPVYNLDQQLHQHKNPTFIQPDHNPGESIAPNKYAKNDVFRADNPVKGMTMPVNAGVGDEVVRASHRVDMSFLEKDPAKKFDNLFRLNRKVRVKNGETFWSAMEKSVADSGESMFVRAAAEGVLKRWKSRGVDQMPFSVSQQTGDGLILAIDHPDFAEEMQKSLAKARKMDEASAKRRGETAKETVTPPEVAPELSTGPLYLSAVYRLAEGVRPKEALIGDIKRSNLSPFVEGAVLRHLERIQGTLFTIKDFKTRSFALKPSVKGQLELAVKIAANREKKGLGNAKVDMSFARPEALKYGEVQEMNGVPTNMEVPLKWHPVQYLEQNLVKKLQARRKVLAANPNNMDLIGRLVNAEHQVKAKCAGMRRMGLRECVKMYVPAQKGRPTKVVWKSTIVESFGRIMNPLFEKPEVSLNGVKRDPSKPLSKRPLPVPEYKKRVARVPKRPLPVPRRYRSPSSTPRPVDRVA